jgi:GNAT superfamily N-acetyltransferase
MIGSASAIDVVHVDRKNRDMIFYRVGNDIDLDAFIDVYRDSTLGERRPVDDRERMAQMLGRANLVVSAWDAERLVGIARSLSDFCYATYLSDIAVRLSYQRQGVGRELIRRTQLEGGKATVFLFAAPKAVDYYARVGFSAGSGWVLRSGETVR